MTRDAPPGSYAPLVAMMRLARRPLERFLAVQAASGAVLLATAAVAMVWANSAWAGSYAALWETPIGMRAGGLSFERSLSWVVNDVLMVLFFFVVGMEIRREIHHGELSDWKRAALPLACALGGMLVPAGLYLLIADTPAARPGWGVPMATDIAFALGTLALLGERVPPALRVLLLALAVVDDLGAILVIAMFYSAGMSWLGIAAAGMGVLLILLLQAIGVRNKLVYVVPGVVVWAGIYAAGVHPTIAGVIIGLLTPVSAWLGPAGFVRDVSAALERLRAHGDAVPAPDIVHQLAVVELARREAVSPAESLIEVLHPWVAFLIMPLFALANAGVVLDDLALAGDELRAAVGAGLGLVLGKPLGIILVAGATVGLGLTSLPIGLRGRHLLVLGTISGIGFTMSLFVAQLAFVSPAMLGATKLGVLLGSGIAGVLGLTLGRVLLRPGESPGAAASADEAEASTAT